MVMQADCCFAQYSSVRILLKHVFDGGCDVFGRRGTGDALRRIDFPLLQLPHSFASNVNIAGLQ